MRQCAAEQRCVVERGTAVRVGIAQRRLDRSARVAFFVAEPAQAPEDLLADVRAGCRDDAAVERTVRMAYVEGCCGSGDMELTCMDGGVMDATDDDEVLGVVGPALRAGHDVV